METKKCDSAIQQVPAQQLHAGAAAEILLSGKRRETVQLMTPKGILLTLELKDIQIEPDKVTCAIQKDAGDDPDTTNGILVYASVHKKKEPGIILDGGIGVGRVTKAGLSQKIGEAAINPVPRQRSCGKLRRQLRNMIMRAVWRLSFLFLKV